MKTSTQRIEKNVLEILKERAAYLQSVIDKGTISPEEIEEAKDLRKANMKFKNLPRTGEGRPVEMAEAVKKVFERMKRIPSIDEMMNSDEGKEFKAKSAKSKMRFVLAGFAIKSKK